MLLNPIDDAFGISISAVGIRPFVDLASSHRKPNEGREALDIVAVHEDLGANVWAIN
jgi:hypothetical protein